MSAIIEISQSYLNNINLFQFKDVIRGCAEDHFFKPNEHYKLLSYLSTFFNNSILIDLGTSNGASAIALSYNDTNRVISFDIVERSHAIIHQRNGQLKLPSYFDGVDFIQTNDFMWYKDLLLKSELILLDIDHGGTKEQELINFLISKNWKGLLLMDDIFQYKELTELWNKIDKIKKYDVTKYGHWSGTGLLNFDDFEIVLN